MRLKSGCVREGLQRLFFQEYILNSSRSKNAQIRLISDDFRNPSMMNMMIEYYFYLRMQCLLGGNAQIGFNAHLS